MKTSQNFHNYNKNFLAMLIRGEGIKEFEKYEFSPLETLFEGKSKKTIKINKNSKNIPKSLLKDLEKIIIRDKTKEKEESLKFLKIVPEDMKNEKMIVKMQRLSEQEHFSLNDFYWKNWFEKIRNYIFKEEGSVSEIYNICKFLILFYEPIDYLDFPHSIVNLEKAKFSHLIEKTSGLNDSHPFKWTQERAEKIKNSENIFYSLLFFSDHLFFWKNFCIPEIPEDLIENSDIRLHHLINEILLILCFTHSSKYIFFNYIDLDILDRLKEVISWFKKIHEKNISFFQ